MPKNEQLHVCSDLFELGKRQIMQLAALESCRTIGKKNLMQDKNDNLLLFLVYFELLC